MEKISAEQIQKEIQDACVNSFVYSDCSICRAPLTYNFYQDHVTLDTNCGCVSYWVEPKRKSYGDVADFLNMQDADVRQQLWHQMLGKQTDASSAQSPSTP